MADITNKYPENVNGAFYTDNQCIDCDLCRETAPGNFTRNDDAGFSYVYHQPATPNEIAQCKEAMEGCPVEAIGSNGVELVDEEIYRDEADPLSRPALVTDITLELKRYFAKHPDKVYNLTPRKFEILVAEILKDFGFDTHLTGATRDGGKDIYAYIRNAVTSFLLFVECKKWAPERKVGIEVVQRVYGAAKASGAHKSLIVTTSFFTQPARQEEERISSELELKDYSDLKGWLVRYK